MGEYHFKFERQQSFNWKVYRSSIKYFTWYSLLHSLRKLNDHSYGFYNCGEYKATSKRFLINIKTIKDNRHKSLGKIVIGHLNINSIRQKIDSLIEITATIIDILIISETKLESEFSKGEFLIKGFSEPYILVCNSKEGGIMLFIREGIASKLLPIEKNSIEASYVEDNQRKNQMVALLFL